MKRMMPLLWAGTLVFGYLAGYAASPAGSAAAGQAARGQAAAQAAAPAGALPPGDYSKMQLAPDQGEPFAWSIDDMKKAHTALVARAAQPTATGGNPRDLFPPLVTRTHSFIMVHRAAYVPGSAAPSAEQHEGVSDIYYIVGGSGTVTVGGTIDNKRISRPGEYGGAIKGGKAFRVKTGDLLNIPANQPHATMADGPDGMTYVLMKVNVGLYPWSLINGTP
jgi:mannose-6-phosphate isomerase-like protein (cupin superfamily)